MQSGKRTSIKNKKKKKKTESYSLLPVPLPEKCDPTNFPAIKHSNPPTAPRHAPPIPTNGNATAAGRNWVEGQRNKFCGKSPDSPAAASPSESAGAQPRKLEHDRNKNGFTTQRANTSIRPFPRLAFTRKNGPFGCLLLHLIPTAFFRELQRGKWAMLLIAREECACGLRSCFEFPGVPAPLVLIGLLPRRGSGNLRKPFYVCPPT